ncbi:MAG: ABC transporter substrate-binding protein [Flavobacteriales bacterium]|nr:ABC transporter substrate-binding protein [Flavobacteriales bacterium]
MKKIVLSFITASVMLLMSCGGGENTASENDAQNSELNSENANRLDFAITEKYHTLDPIKVTNVVSFHIVSQIYEPLLRFDEKDLSLQPLLAESWFVSEDNLVVTFQLKKGVHFQDNDCFEGGKGRELKASDVIYSFNRIYSESERNYAYSLYKGKVKGSEEYRNSGGEISGLKALDDYTVEFTLNKPSSNFHNLLATVSSAIVPKEAIEKNAVAGSGPFTYSKVNDTESAITLLKNQNYHISDKKGNKLPYLESVAFNYVKSGQDQLKMFMNNKLDIITGIPPESVKDIVESQIADFQDKPVKYVLGRYPQVTTTFLNLNTSIAPFNKLKVRQALGMAVNKTKIVDDVLKGEAYGAGNHGIVPSAIKNYDFSSVVGHEYNVSKAKDLLANAGFPDGKGFPTLKFAVGKGNTSLRVALEIQKELLTNLNINVEISSLSLKEIMELNGTSKINLSLSGWLAEIPDPVTFLSLFYGEDVPASNEESSYPNESRYKNDQFDKLYEEALVTIDTKKRYELCLTADQIIAEEVPVIPLWYHENYQLIQSVVKDYQPNSMNIHYLTYVKIESTSVEKSQ